MRIVSSGVAILSLIISRKWLGGLSLNAPQNKSRQCPDSEIRNISISPFSEFRNRKDTSNALIPSVVLVSKFARRSISECGDLRNHDTSILLNLVWFSDLKFLNANAIQILGTSNPPHWAEWWPMRVISVSAGLRGHLHDQTKTKRPRTESEGALGASAFRLGGRGYRASLLLSSGLGAVVAIVPGLRISRTMGTVDVIDHVYMQLQ